MSELKAWNNGSETVIATSAEDAATVLAEEWGEDPDKHLRDHDHKWVEVTLPTLTIDTDSDRGKVTQTLAEWIVENGRGILCSTEW